MTIPSPTDSNGNCSSRAR